MIDGRPVQRSCSHGDYGNGRSMAIRTFPVSRCLSMKAYTVIGVLPEWFTWPNTRVQMWTPMYHERSEQMQSHISHSFNAMRGSSRALLYKRREPISTPCNDRFTVPFRWLGESRSQCSAYRVFGNPWHSHGPVYLAGRNGMPFADRLLNVANLMVARRQRVKEKWLSHSSGGSRARRLRAN